LALSRNEIKEAFLKKMRTLDGDITSESLDNKRQEIKEAFAVLFHKRSKNYYDGMFRLGMAAQGEVQL
jgi:DnaJ-class molecular chaperone